MNLPSTSYKYKSILLLGDLAYPHLGSMTLKGKNLFSETAYGVANLEGPLEPAGLPIKNKLKFNLFSSLSLIRFSRKFNLNAVSLANNHAGDYLGGVQRTQHILKNEGISFFGLKSEPYHTCEIAGKSVFILGCCSSLTECKSTPDFPVNMFNTTKILNQIKDLRQNNPEGKIIVFIHWGYELSSWPQPADRRWAHKAIDSGANFVIGHHPHVVQGIETYNDGFIAYSLGNWVLPQVRFNDKKISYKSDESCKQVAIEISFNGTSKDIIIHSFFYDKTNHCLIDKGAIDSVTNPWLKDLSCFKGMSHKDYDQFFLKLQSSKGTPSGYPTFWSYERWLGTKTIYKKGLIEIRRLIRKYAIKLGLHRPYNWTK